MVVHSRGGVIERHCRGSKPWRWATAALASLLIAAISPSLTTAQREGVWWRDNQGGPASSNYVDLDQITKENVDRLEVAWFYPYGATVFNPIVVDNVLYGLGRGGSLLAIDATTGKEIWIHEGLSGITPRGINYWQSEDGSEKRLLFAINGYLQAVDATTGQSILSFGNNGYVDLRDGLARANTGRRIQSSSPGKVWKNILVMGSATGEGFMSPPGDIRAYDVRTGERLWQFHTIPQPGEFGYDTWPKEAYKYAGGANAWGDMSIDEARGIAYIPTGSATYDFYGADRHGDNLFANCILALDVRTGKRLWHFQTVHHDLWDFDNVSAPQLITVDHDGRRIDAVAHAGKTGFLYVFDRVTGQPLWPIEERPVPQSDVPGERSSATQPFPTKPAPFARMSFGVDDVSPLLLTPEEYQSIRERVAKARNFPGPFGGLFIPPALDQEVISMPGNTGGSNWGTAASNPDKGLVFVLNLNAVALLKLEDVTTRGGTGRGGGGAAAGAAAYQQHCLACHGQNLEGVLPGMPSIVGVTNRMGDDAIRAIVTSGKGLMRPVSNITSQELSAVMSYIENYGAGRGGRGGGRGNVDTFPPGPVVARGGVPRPQQAPPEALPLYPGNGGNAGNLAYPDDVADVPSRRYMSDYGVLAAATKAPHTTITAYDLNTGEIKWQVPAGDDLRTLALGGPSNTGAVNLRNGFIVTKSGLLFLVGGDRKVRAYDQDTGEVLWTSQPFAGGSGGVPAMYESNGRQYLIVASDPGGARNVAAVSDPNAIPADMPRGYIAYALPSR